MNRVVDKMAALSAKWQIRVSLSTTHRDALGAVTEDSLKLCFDTVADMQMWAEAIEWASPPDVCIADSIAIIDENGEELCLSEGAFNDRSVVTTTSSQKSNEEKSGRMNEYDAELVTAYAKLASDESRLMSELTSENARVSALRDAKEALVAGIAPSFANLDLCGLTQATRDEMASAYGAEADLRTRREEAKAPAAAGETRGPSLARKEP
jgi:hypothetical protein